MRSTTLFSSLALGLALGTTAAVALPSPNGGFSTTPTSSNNNNGGTSANPSSLVGFGAFRNMCTMPAMQSCAENGHDAPDCFEHLCPMAAAMSSPQPSQNQSRPAPGQHAKRIDAFSCTDANLFQCAIAQWRPAQDCILELCP